MQALTGKGVWIQRVRAAEADGLAARLRPAGLQHVLLKIADGADPHNAESAAAVTAQLTAAGLTVWGWQRLYGERPAFKGPFQPDYHLRELETAQAQLGGLRAHGLAGLVLEARGEYERSPAREQRAAAFLAGLPPDLPLALSSWKSPAAHPRFPWTPFRERCQLDLPAVFWVGQHGEGARQLQAAARQFRALTPARPLAAAGPAFFEANWRPAPQDLLEFLQTAAALGLAAVNVWHWDHLHWTGEEPPAVNPARADFRPHWQVLVAFQWPAAAQPASDHSTAAAQESASPQPIEPAAPTPEPAPEASAEAALTTELAALLGDDDSAGPDLAWLENPLPEPAVEAALEGERAPEASAEAALTTELAALLGDDDSAGPDLAWLEDALPEPAAEAAPTPEPAPEASAEAALTMELAALLGDDDSAGPDLAWLEGAPPEPAGEAAPTPEPAPEASAEPALTTELAALLGDDDSAGPDRAWLEDAPPEPAAEATPTPEPAPETSAEAALTTELAALLGDDDSAGSDLAWLEDALPEPAAEAAPTPEAEPAEAPAAFSLPSDTAVPVRAVFASGPAAASAAVPETVGRFFKALRQRRLDEAVAAYAAGSLHVTATRVRQEPAATRALYADLLAGWQAGGPVVERAAGAPGNLRVHWSAHTLTGAVVHGEDEFHLNRRGEIVYHRTTVDDPLP